ncbi:MAG: tripartite tricarboxylate transporter substrate binding protein [Burkholderiales bacterium]
MTSITRQLAIGLFGLFTLLAATGKDAFAQEFPMKTVRLVLPNGPSGGADLMARLYQQSLQEMWKQPVVLEYKPGAAMAVATEYVARSAPDGYIIGLVSTPLVINPSLRSNLPFDTVKDISGVTLGTIAHIVLLASNGFPAHTTTDVIATAKRQSGGLNYASPGAGTSMHLAMELLMRNTGIDMQHIPYKGSAPALLEIMAGRVPLMFSPLHPAIAYIKGGKLKAIAVASAARARTHPDLPTIAETVPGFEVVSFSGMIVASGTPRNVVRKLNADVVSVLKRPAFRAKLEEIGVEPVGNTPEQFDAYIKSEIEKWAPIVKASGAQPD